MISRSCNRIETIYVLGIARESHENRTKPAFLPTIKVRMSKNDVNVYKQNIAIRLTGSVSEKSIHYCILEKTSRFETY